VRSFRTPGSVEGVTSNGHPYSDHSAPPNTGIPSMTAASSSSFRVSTSWGSSSSTHSAPRSWAESAATPSTSSTTSLQSEPGRCEADRDQWRGGERPVRLGDNYVEVPRLSTSDGPWRRALCAAVGGDTIAHMIEIIQNPARGRNSCPSAASPSSIPRRITFPGPKKRRW
jgi:hypothetical protein